MFPFRCITDPEPLMDRRQQRSVSGARLRRSVRLGDFLHDPSPPRCERSVRLPGRAQSRRSHGTKPHGQSVRESRHERWHQRIRSEHGPWPEVVQHCCSAHESQGTQCSHLLGHMIAQTHRHSRSWCSLTTQWENETVKRTKKKKNNTSMGEYQSNHDATCGEGQRRWGSGLTRRTENR